MARAGEVKRLRYLVQGSKKPANSTNDREETGRCPGNQDHPRDRKTRGAPDPSTEREKCQTGEARAAQGLGLAGSEN